MKEKIYVFVIGLLLGGIIATGGLFIYQKCNETSTDNTQANEQMQMPSGDNSNGQMPGGNGGTPPAKPGDSSSSVTKSGATELTSDVTETGKEYGSTESDENAILVKDGASVSISDGTVDKSAGDSSNVENSEFYGVNAGVLVESSSTATLKNMKISTSAKGANAVFSTGTDSKVYISDSEITTTKDSSRGLDATYGGYIEADNVKISTQGGSCATLATDRGEGTFNASNSSLSIDSSSSLYKTAPFFFITNTDAIINLENNKLSYGSGILLKAEGTSEWGNSGSNGGNVTLNAKNQSLVGDVECDSISTVTINLADGSYLESAINGDNGGKSVVLKLDASSKLKLTGDCYVTSLDDADESYSNIDFNGFTLYVNGSAIN